MPRITALIGDSVRTASETRFRYRAPNPSERLYPSADSSKVWHLDVGDIAPNLVEKSCISGVRIKLVPATIAESQSPFLKAFTARCKAYIEDEQAVSSVRLTWARSAKFKCLKCA